jgi:hypothetical protein
MKFFFLPEKVAYQTIPLFWYIKYEQWTREDWAGITVVYPTIQLLLRYLQPSILS